MLFFLSFYVNAQTHFGDQQVITMAEVFCPEEIITIDIDNDGDQDVVSASSLDNKVAWYENDGTGNFLTQIVISSSADGAFAVLAADIDNDADWDVIAASKSDRTIAWYENDGTGHFSTAKIISKGEYAASDIAVSDLNGDGYEDVVASKSQKAADVIWYVNDGMGNFGTAQKVIENVDSPQQILGGDMDNDGDQDVLVAFFPKNKVVWYENDGTGNFITEHLISNEIVNAWSVEVADFDGDGDLDLFADGQTYAELSWYPNNGDGEFGSKQTIGMFFLLGKATCVTDLDGDDDQDIIIIEAFTNQALWQENDGLGNFKDPQLFGDIHIGDILVGIHADDLNGDNIQDLLTIEKHEDNILWHQNDGALNFESKEVAQNPTFWASSVHSADLDNDGDMDVLSSSEGNDRIAWYKNDGKGNFGTQLIISEEAVGARMVNTGDLDGDGYVDVLSASSGDQDIAWYKNDGTGNFGAKTIINPNDNQPLIEVHAVDIDADGDLDVAASYRSWYIKIFINDGKGNFGTPLQISTALDAVNLYLNYHISFADFNGDNFVDILSTDTNSDKIFWFENNGNGGFSNIRFIDFDLSLVVKAGHADLDGDGDQDVIGTCSNGTRIVWCANDGNGNFAEQQIVDTYLWGNGTSPPVDVHTTDIDGDGDIDILLANAATQKTLYDLTWYENDGTGNFGTFQVITNIAFGARDIHTADLDGDGDEDVLSASFEDNKIAWYENKKINLPSCNPNPGTMPLERQIICASNDSFAVTSTDAIVEADAELWYIIHDSPSNELGAILDYNQTGHFSPSALNEISFNEEYYVSALVGPTNDGQLPDISDTSCVVINEGTPIVFLSPISIEVLPDCNTATGVVSIYIEINGGLPSYDFKETYTIVGAYNGSLMAGESVFITIDAVTDSTTLTFNMMDANNCVHQEMVDIACYITSIEPTLPSFNIQEYNNHIFIEGGTQLQSIVLMNTSGQVIYQQTGLGDNVISMEDLATGVYLLNLVFREKVITKKVIRLRDY